MARTVGGVRVADVIELKASHGLDHPPGVVLVLDAFPHADPRSLVGMLVTVCTPGGAADQARIGDMRDHGPTISLFFADLPPAFWVVGGTVSFSERTA